MKPDEVINKHGIEVCVHVWKEADAPRPPTAQQAHPVDIQLPSTLFLVWFCVQYTNLSLLEFEVEQVEAVISRAAKRSWVAQTKQQHTSNVMAKEQRARLTS